MRIQDIMPKVVELIEKAQKEASASLIKSGYRELDDMIDGIYPGEIAVICSSGELGVGFAQNVILNQLKAKPDASILIICPKMAKEQYVMSLISIKSEVPISSISEANPPLDQEERDRIALATEELLKSQIQISEDRVIETRAGFSELEELYSASSLYLMVIDNLDSIGFKRKVAPHPVDQPDKNIKAAELTKAEAVALKISILNEIARRFHLPILCVYGNSVDNLDLNSDVNLIEAYFNLADVVVEIGDKRLGETGLVDLQVRKTNHGKIGNTSLYYCDELACFDSMDLGDQ
jgi:replicative DNA helicase